MQGQSSAVGSLTETLNFDQGSTPSETGIDQPIYWNNVRNSAPDRLSEYVPPSNTSSAYANSIVSDRRNLRAWSMDEPGPSIVRNPISHNEQKMEQLWVSTTRACPAGHDVENRWHQSDIGLSINNVNLSGNQIANGPLFMQSSSSNSSQDLNINAGSGGQGVDDRQIVEHPLVFRSGSENSLIPNHSSSIPFDLQRSEHVEDSDGGPSSLIEGRRLSRKRKATEEDVGQSSGSGSSNYFQHAESSLWRAIPAPRNTNNSLTISAPSENNAGVIQSEQVNPRLGLGVGSVSSESSPAISATRNTEISRRNLRLRISSSQRQDSLPSNVFTGGTAVGSSSISAPRQASRLLPHSNSLSPEVADANPQSQSLLAHVPAMGRNLQSSRWTRSSSSRAGSTSNSVIEGDAASPGESSARFMLRNRLEHSVFRNPSRVRNSVHTPNDSSASGGNDSIAGNAASSSRGASAAGSRQGSGHNWFPDRRRLSEIIRRSLSASGSESGGQNIDISPPHSHTSDSDQEMPLPSEGQERHPSHSRSALLLDRHLGDASGLSHSLRTLAAASEGRSRLVSEQIHDVLDLMRRGEGLRFEDVMILDQSVFFGMGDHHDRHRDMRLDVDNMSYEELLALEERIGNVNTGVSEETISSRLKQSKYTVSATTDLQEPEPCCICQDEYSTGDEVGELECGHGFHAECIKQWLTRKNLCPICKTTAMGSK
ncbi:E3 ubiquitin-protein like [Heracleum sosnowskyi]|uniref:RING-type E3 ubiquitin transferase n=1 Tax=Heracleum sosnowskyi TaxID=360622 RepID=A0AAD8IUL7_9APIA|nr:E3 ubiquitin-protein like [Heracleum sosnowskyi]